MDEMNKNQLYYGDNLDIFRRYIADENVDIIYLDPPLTSTTFKKRPQSRTTF